MIDSARVLRIDTLLGVNQRHWVLTEQESVGGDERVARLIQAARELIDAYERKSTATEHFLKLEAAVERWAAPVGSHEPTRIRQPRRPGHSGPASVRAGSAGTNRTKASIFGARPAEAPLRPVVINRPNR
jgi:hypothetical protein